MPQKTLGFDLGRGFARLIAIKNLLDDAGELAFGVLRVEADIADDETVTIGTDEFEVDIIDTDTVQETLGAMTDDQTFIVSDLGVWAIPPAVGDVLEVETEFVLVTEIQRVGTAADTFRATIIRGWAGSTAATHIDTTTINQSDAIPTGISVPTNAAGVTPALFTDALAAIINSGAVAPVGVGLAPNARFIQPDQAGLVVAKGETDNDLIVAARTKGALALATTETLGGAANAWEDAVLGGGAAAVVRHVAVIEKVPSATDVTATEMHFPLDFAPIFVHVALKITSGGALSAYDGDVIVTAAAGVFPDMITINQSGANDFAETDTVQILAVG